MQAVWANIKGWFTSAIADLPDWARKLLGEESPSKVFMKIGGNIMKGLGIGISAETKYPQTAMSQGIADTMRPAMATSSVVNNSYRNTSMTVNANVSGGVSLNQFQQMLKQTIKG